jgi:hypothetical protein
MVNSPQADRVPPSIAQRIGVAIGRPIFELRFPDRDLVRMHVELLRKLRKRSIAFDRRNSHFRLESRCVVPARSSLHGLS